MGSFFQANRYPKDVRSSMSHCLDENTALELIDGRLPSILRADIERHLEGCPSCRELASELAKEEDDAASGAESAIPLIRTAAAVNGAPRVAVATGMLRRGAKAGPYRVEESIGSGSAGTVFRAVDERTNQTVALKLVTDLGLRVRFAREAETLARLDHDAIVRYVGHGETDAGMYLAMEWLEGEDLERRFQRGAIGWEGARTLGLRVSAGLAHAHALGCVHRDISPRNVFLPEGRLERAKLLDFGLVRVEGDVLARTATNAVMGTPFYMSPEQIRDPKRVTERSDLFGLGVLLFEAICGLRPFEGEDLFSVWIKIVDQPHGNIRANAKGGVPEPFALLIEQMLSKDPTQRPASAKEVNERLLALSMAPSSSATAMMAPMRPPPQFGGHPPPQAILIATTTGQLAPTAPDMRPLGSYRPAISAPPAAPTAPPPQLERPTSTAEANVRMATLAAAAFLIVGVAAVGGALAYEHFKKPTPTTIHITGGGDREETKKPVERFPVACRNGDTIYVSGNWNGPGPAITSVAQYCKLFVSNATIVSSSLLSTDAPDLEITLDNVVLNASDVGLKTGPALVLTVKDSQLTAQRDAVVSSGRLAIEVTRSKIGGTHGAAIRAGKAAEVNLENSTLFGAQGIAAQLSAEVRMDRESAVTATAGIAIEGGAGSRVVLDGGSLSATGSAIKATISLKVEATGGVILSTGDTTVAATDAAEVTLSGSKLASSAGCMRFGGGAQVSVSGGGVDCEGDMLVGGANLLLTATRNASLGTRGNGIAGTTNTTVTLEDAALAAKGTAIKGLTNTVIRLKSATLSGGQAAIDAGSAMELETVGSTILSESGPAVSGGFGAVLVANGGMIRGTPALVFLMRPMTVNVSGTQIVGEQKIPPR